MFVLLVLFGELSVFVAPFVENRILLTVLMLVHLKVWNGGAKILGRCILLVASPYILVLWNLFPCIFGVTDYEETGSGK